MPPFRYLISHQYTIRTSNLIPRTMWILYYPLFSCAHSAVSERCNPLFLSIFPSFLVLRFFLFCCIRYWRMEKIGYHLRNIPIYTLVIASSSADISIRYLVDVYSSLFLPPSWFDIIDYFRFYTHIISPYVHFIYYLYIQNIFTLA